MATQNYSNHVRYYPAHHFVFYPLALAMIVFSIYCSFHYPDQQMIWWFAVVIIAMMTFLSFMVRQHYALNNQNRIVRLELRLRYYILTHERFENIENQLSLGQLFALRFASDEEFPVLVQRAVSEKLSADEIKKAIVNWLPDEMRV